MHSELKLVIESKDVERVEAMIAECRSLGLPEQDFLGACKLKHILDDMLVELRMCASASSRNTSHELDLSHYLSFVVILYRPLFSFLQVTSHTHAHLYIYI